MSGSLAGLQLLQILWVSYSDSLTSYLKITEAIENRSEHENKIVKLKFCQIDYLFV